MKTTTNSSENNSENKKFRLPYRFVSSPKRKEHNEIIITPPKICPICGRKDVDGEFKLCSTKNGNKFITVLLCSEHKELSEKDQNMIPLCLSLISLLVISFFMPILFLLITVFMTFLIFAIVMIFFVFRTVKAFKGSNNISFVNKYINLKCFKTSYVLSIKRSDWIKEFKSLNQVSEYKVDLELIEDLKKKIKRTAIHLGIMATICFIGMIILFILFLLTIIAYIITYIITIILIFLLIGACAFFPVKILYYETKIENVED